MPYRRLPNTDRARLKALKSAVKKGRSTPPFSLAYSQSLLVKTEFFVNHFQKAIANYRNAYDIQVARNKDFIANARKARVYLSHFIQVLNLAIVRGELSENVRLAFGMDVDERKLPDFTSDKDLMEWGQKIIHGETMRISQGHPPITNPTIAVVKVRYENFMEGYNNQRVLQQNTQRYKAELDELRIQADEIILSIWDEVEASLKELPDHERREEAQEYGLVYVYRKNELKNLQLFHRIEYDI